MIMHYSMDVEGAIRNAKDLKGCIKVDGKKLYTVAEIRTFLRGQLALGRKFLPLCDCLGFNFVNGCPGHEKLAEERHEAIMKIARSICDEEKMCNRYCGLCNDCNPYKEAEKIYEERKRRG